jgi:hypothetical protein
MQPRATRDKLLDMIVCIVPKLDRVAKIEWAPHNHDGIGKRKGNVVKLL